MKRPILLICAIVAVLCVQAQSNERYEDLINRTDKSDYAMGEYDKREILLLWRTDDKEDETKTEGKAGEAHE